MRKEICLVGGLVAAAGGVAFNARVSAAEEALRFEVTAMTSQAVESIEAHALTCPGGNSSCSDTVGSRQQIKIG